MLSGSQQRLPAEGQRRHTILRKQHDALTALATLISGLMIGSLVLHDSGAHGFPMFLFLLIVVSVAYGYFWIGSEASKRLGVPLHEEHHRRT